MPSPIPDRAAPRPGSSPAGRRATSARRTTLAGATALTTAALPVFLVGALGDSIRTDLGLSETAIGALVTVLFVSAALTATPAGRLAERVGSGLALRLGVGIAGIVALVVGLMGSGWWSLVVPLAVGGLGMALIDTGAARAFADRVPPRAQGLAFGIKEASIPSASMLAGLSLPTLAVAFGWRAGFVGAAVVAAVVLVALPAPRSLVADPGTAQPPPGGRVASPAVVRFAIAAGLGTGAATAGATFLVPSITDRGVSPSVAGIVLSVASLASIWARIGVGRWADRQGAQPVPAVTAMLVLGGASAALLVADVALPLVVLGAIGVLGAGWGWTGLAFLAVVRATPHAPAAAAGVVLTGLGTGGAFGPLAFGALAERGSFALAWAVACVAMVAGSGLASTAREALRPRPSVSGDNA